MNDFTKEELQIILLDMDINIKKAPPLKPSPIYIELRSKVELMINNYCEHEWRCFDDQYNTRECIKCAERLQGEVK